MNHNNKKEFEVKEENEKQRLDAFLSQAIPEFSRSHIKRLIDEDQVWINEKREKASYKVKVKDKVSIFIPQPKKLKIEPEPIPLDIIYEDADIIVINKPQGMVVHPAVGNESGTLVNALLYHCEGQLSGINGVVRPGIVHRLDKDTSGVMMVAKTNSAHLHLADQIKARTVKKIYLGLVHGNIKTDQGIIDAPIGRHPVERKRMAVVQQHSRHAITHFKVRERFGDYSFMELALETGRTHQIRVHMAYIHHPIVCDPVYGPKKEKFNLSGQFLHAHILGFDHPKTKNYMEFKVSLPAEMERILSSLKPYEKNN